MLPLDRLIVEYPYLFRILGSVILFWILWIPFGNRLILATEELVKTMKDIFHK